MKDKKTFVRRDDMNQKEKTAKLVKAEGKNADEFKKKGEAQIALAKALVVDSDADYINGANILLKAKELQKTIDAEKEPIIKPAKEIIKSINAKYKPAEDVLEQIDTIVRKKVLDHNNAMEAKAQEELEKLNNQIQGGKIKDQAKIDNKLDVIHSQVPAKTVHTGTGSIQIRQVKKLVIVNRDLIPDEYWVVDEVKLREAVLKLEQVVPGADWKFENTLAVI